MVQVVTKALKETKTVIFDEAIIAVMSASLIAPFFVPRINSVMDSVPVLRDHKSISAIVAGVLTFAVAKGVKMPNIFRAIIIGIAGAFILAGVLPLYTQVTNRGVGN
jgi:hypothetical protein